MAIGDDEIAFSAGDGPSHESIAPASSVHVSTQASFPYLNTEAQIQLLNQDLESRKQEKLQLFKEWQSLKRHDGMSHVGTGDDVSRLLSPPPDFMAQVIIELREAHSHRSDALIAMEKVFGDLRNHGLDGANAQEIISDLSSRFRHARLELDDRMIDRRG